MANIGQITIACELAGLAENSPRFYFQVNLQLSSTTVGVTEIQGIPDATLLVKQKGKYRIISDCFPIPYPTDDQYTVALPTTIGYIGFIPGPFVEGMSSLCKSEGVVYFGVGILAHITFTPGIFQQSRLVSSVIKDITIPKDIWEVWMKRWDRKDDPVEELRNRLFELERFATRWEPKLKAWEEGK